MSKQVNFYAIRIVGTDYFMISRNHVYDTFEVAMKFGVVFNTVFEAQRRIRDEIDALKAQKEVEEDGYPPVGARYDIFIDGKWKSFTPSQEFANRVKDSYEITVRDIELEVVPLVMSIA